MKHITDQFSAPEERVFYEVLRHIARRRLQRARVRAGLYGFFLIGAIVALGPSVEYLASRATVSGFTEYVSLIVSDGSHLSGSWGALMLSLAESAPIAGALITLSALTAAAYCARKFSASRQFLYRSIA